MVVSQVVLRGLRYEVHLLMSQVSHRSVTDVGGSLNRSVPLGDKNNVKIHFAPPPYFNSTALIESCYE